MRQGVKEIVFAKEEKKGENELDVGELYKDAADYVSNSTCLSILTSRHRDFLLSPSGSRTKVSELKDKVIGLYFSANWYPPCRNFNKALCDSYEQLKKCDYGFEIVFVSCDEDSDAFEHYRSSMPWLAIPYSDLETKRALNRRFHIEAIPCLIILQPNTTGDKWDDDAELRDGVELIYRYGAQAFPFTKERLEQLQEEERKRHERQTLINLLTNHDRDFLLGHPSPKKVEVTSLMGKTVGLYFSAQWCLPGVKFTPKLISIYHNIKQMLSQNGTTTSINHEDFEIVLVSSDRDQITFNAYFNTMPWLALPFGDPTIKDLAKHFDIQEIPCLVILGTDGKTVTKQGRNLVNLYQERAYPFTAERVEILEKELDEQAKSLPRYEYHSGHRHGLTLVSEGNGGGPFICCDCDEQGSGWAYQCLECGYEVHPKCVRSVGHDPN